MPGFAVSAQAADETRLPVVEGISLQIVRSVKAAARTSLTSRIVALTSVQLGGSWKANPSSGDDWLDLTPVNRAMPPPLDRTWDVIRSLQRIPGVMFAEPLVLLRVPSAEDASAAQRFGLWGASYDADTTQRIEAASLPPHWSLDDMNVSTAWKAWQEKRGQNTEPGSGILVAHPDTGYTLHPQVLPSLRENSPSSKTYGWSFVERLPDGTPRPDALDSLVSDGFLPNPGHGTGTASVIASRRLDVQTADKDVWGVAPGAALLPLRVSTSVVHLSFVNLAQAFEKAIAAKADVISMSLGGPVSSARLEEVVQRALDAGIIVVSAAGNMLPTVVFPAKLPGVLGVAASNPLRIPWRLSGLGEEVAITAPGEMVWHAVADPAKGAERWNGTSFSAAAVAGLAALWLSFHGKDTLRAVYDGDAALIPYAFRLAIQNSADTSPAFLDSGRGGFGTGIARADGLLSAPLPSLEDVRKERDFTLGLRKKSWIEVTWKGLWQLLRMPTKTPDGGRSLAPTDSPAGIAEEAAIRSVVESLLGGPVTGKGSDGVTLSELTHLVGSSPPLQLGLLAAAQKGRTPGNVPLTSLRRAFLAQPISAALRERLTAAQEADKGTLVRGGQMPTLETALAAYATPLPPVRRLRAYAFDPSLATRLKTSVVNTVTVDIPFEAGLTQGPVGEYLEVVDVDPATGCAYAPVDLNHPFLLAQDGLAPSEGNPQFHQQMVYAVAMKTIGQFEEALGRPIFWSPLRPWLAGSGDAERAARRLRADGKPEVGDQYVQRLRLYPHALREENAYYSPQKRALLFGYFPSRDDDPGSEYPGGLVFTCLSHDIIAHEMTHAILDGMHTYFTEPTNPDVFAFHEAFADMVALFAHFSYPEVLRNQIGETRGSLDTENLLVQLAQQFGRATGQHQALRDAIGTASGPEAKWKRYTPDPGRLPLVTEAHERGSLLVAAVFDAYLAIYSDRVEDLKRIATGGTGILPEGRLHPDLVNRMADEAAKSAQHVLRMCIRAMDYVPPVDITFGEFLRALITADYDLVPDDTRQYRVAFIESFRKWGIYPRDVRTLSEESLRWHAQKNVALFPPAVTSAVRSRRGGASAEEANEQGIRKGIRNAVQAWKPGGPRETVFQVLHTAQAALNAYLSKLSRADHDRASSLLPGIDLTVPFSVSNLRPARRVGPENEFLTEAVVEIVQTKKDADGRDTPFRGGVTLIIGLDDWTVRYGIYKRIGNAERETRQAAYQGMAFGVAAKAAEYCCGDAAGIDLSLRTTNREAMRADSCRCRASKNAGGEEDALREPFALLHRRVAGEEAEGGNDNGK